MSAPFLPLYVGDYLRDTRGLTAEQHGAYLLLLMCMWTSGGSLPNEDRKLARFASCTPSRWTKIRDDIMEFFVVQDGVVIQKRLKAELEKATEKSIKNRENGSAGGKAKSLKNKDASLASASETPQQRARGLPEPEPEREKEDAAPPPAGGVASPSQPEASPSPASPPNGASSSGRARRGADRVDDTVRRAEAEEVLRDPQASDEDRFFALRYRLEDKGVRWSRAMELRNTLADEGYGPVVAALDKTLRARNPSTYLGAIVADRRKLQRKEAGEPEPPRRANGAHAAEPQFVRDYREDGWDVAADGPNRWVIAGQIYDETGEVIGW